MKRRVARLLEEDDVDAASVLPVTFTRVAAEDLHRELVSLAVDSADQLNGRTLHGLAMAILRRNHVLETLGRNPRPLNDYEMEPLLADLSASHGNKWARRRLIDAYVAAWSRLQHEDPGIARSAQDQAFADDLVEWLVLHEAMLIGELIPHLHQYLYNNPAAPERSEFTHVLIDEYQDLNRVEQEALNLIGAGGSICVIGDDDQSIYSFKHAHPAGIRDWTELNDASDFQIRECRRCPTKVVRMANALIARNRDRTPREMVEVAENGEGEVVIRQYPSADAEADAVATKIATLVAAGIDAGEIVVLAQRATFGTPIFDRLRLVGVPVKSYYAEAELDTPEARERFAVLKLFLNNEDRVALRWLLGSDHHEWHRSQYARVLRHVRQSGESPWSVLGQLRAGTLGIQHTHLLVARFAAIVDELEELKVAPDIDMFISLWLPPNEATVLLSESVEACRPGCEGVQELYDRLYLMLTQPEIPMEVAETRIMSLHKCKGISSPYVFIVGCVEGLLPSRFDGNVATNAARMKLEEDRRLFYVGLTRVKARPDLRSGGYLALTYPQTMPLADALRSQIQPVSNRGGIARLLPSRFLSELGEAAPVPESGTPL
jgi:DNA helicase II / ATP-dependent DNA helicase PcrA